MADPRSAGIFAALRAAAHQGEERHLVGLRPERERQRIAGALTAEGKVLEAPSTRSALELLAAESFELAVLDLDEGQGWSALPAGKELRPFTDLVFVMVADPARCGDAYAAGAAAVVPRPLPENEALLRAHLRWLASCRRSRTRGLLLRNALVRHGDELAETEPALAKALAEIAGEADHEPTVMVMGDADLVRVAGGHAVETSPDVVVVGLQSADNLDTRLREARARASGAAVVMVDGAATSARMQAALYGGARAYLVRAQLPHLGRVVGAAAGRRRAEVTGRRLVETLARFGALDETAPRTSSGSAARDVDARLIADATSSASPFVPSGHEVLVVDDEAVVLTVLREALRRGGYRVTTAASGEEAIDLMRQRRFDLVLTDKNLPGASGLEVLRVARGLDPPPAVVLITGYSSYDSAVEALDIGAQDYIEKPIRDLENLRFRIRRALSRRDEQLSSVAKSSDKPQGASARVLIVEVEGSRRQLMAEFLGRNYKVIAVADGAEALRRLQDERFDVVLADRNLPGLSGLRVIEQAQRLLPHCACVLYTAYPAYDTVKEAFELGVDAFCVRPSEDLKSLADKVAGALRSRGGILLG
jgi:DNA-binding NtrC family response regulator